MTRLTEPWNSRSTTSAAAQADRIEMDNHQTRDLVIPVETASRMFGETLGTVRTRILAISSECPLQCASARTAPHAEAVIWCAVIDALTELSSREQIGERAKAQRKRRGRHAGRALNTPPPPEATAAEIEQLRHTGGNLLARPSERIAAPAG
ncbi:MAG TPA: hypothetical protein PLX84_14590 [Acidiphilium sp.]|nr:hypothetical protein [Acidiphilium sp.]